MKYYRPASLRVDANGGGSVNYEPNSLNGPVQCAAFDEPPLRITGDPTDMITATATMIIRRGNLFRLMNPEQCEIGRYRSTYAGRQCTAGDSVAADLPFLPRRSGLWNRRCPGSRD